MGAFWLNVAQCGLIPAFLTGGEVPECYTGILGCLVTWGETQESESESGLCCTETGVPMLQKRGCQKTQCPFCIFVS